MPCYLCKSETVIQLLDCGSQPICNRYLVNSTDDEYTHPMVISQCQACGLIQISDPVPAAEVLPRHEWITYTEPEEHLDELAGIIATLPDLTEESRVCGISYKDDSLVSRLKDRGFRDTWRLEPERDLGITQPGAGDETVQDRLTSKTAQEIAANQGRSSVVIARHILEHSHDTLDFLRALEHLTEPGGYIVIEVPDTVKALEGGDASSLWEEHILYFTPQTFRSAFAYGGFSVVRYDVNPYSDENTMTVVAHTGQAVTPVLPETSLLKEELSRATGYFDDLASQRSKTARSFSEIRRNQGRIALFGAGHRSSTYLNLLGLKDYVDFVVDDDPNKRGLFMPGSQLPIKGSAALTAENIKICFLAVKSESEDKIIRNNQAYLDQGGRFSSIYPSSKLAL